jgi:hypothetical protein
LIRDFVSFVSFQKIIAAAVLGRPLIDFRFLSASETMQLDRLLSDEQCSIIRERIL